MDFVENLKSDPVHLLPTSSRIDERRRGRDVRGGGVGGEGREREVEKEETKIIYINV